MGFFDVNTQYALNRHSHLSCGSKSDPSQLLWLAIRSLCGPKTKRIQLIFTVLQGNPPQFHRANWWRFIRWKQRRIEVKYYVEIGSGVQVLRIKSRQISMKIHILQFW